MAKGIAKLPDSSVNLPKSSLILELIQLCVGFVFVLAIVFFVLGLFIDIAVSYVSPQLEAKVTSSIGERLFKDYSSKSETKHKAEQVKLQNLLDKIVLRLDENQYPADWFKLSIMDSDVENAFATLGGNIIITTGLIDASRSENELAMVIGHEVGHIINKDHLKGLGRAFFLIIGMSILPSEFMENSLFNLSLNSNMASHSREQEYEADELGIELLVSHYGHGAGASKFFERAAKTEGGILSRFTDFNATHPGSLSRIKKIKNYLSQRNIEDQELTPLIIGPNS